MSDAATSIAFHEAGHAVAFWSFGQRLGLVTIDASLKPGNAGLREFRPRLERRAPERSDRSGSGVLTQVSVRT